MANMIIIGKGPAGISASLYILRAGIETTIIAKDGIHYFTIISKYYI